LSAASTRIFSTAAVQSITFSAPFIIFVFCALSPQTTIAAWAPFTAWV
jgi:hypothetical protein